MNLPQDVKDAIKDILENYSFTRAELRVISLFLQTLLEYEVKK